MWPYDVILLSSVTHCRPAWRVSPQQHLAPRSASGESRGCRVTHLYPYVYVPVHSHHAQRCQRFRPLLRATSLQHPMSGRCSGHSVEAAHEDAGMDTNAEEYHSASEESTVDAEEHMTSSVRLVPPPHHRLEPCVRLTGAGSRCFAAHRKRC